MSFEEAATPVTQLQGRIESVFARRFAIFSWLLGWSVTGVVLLHSWDVFFDPKEALSERLVALVGYAVLAGGGPYLWRRYAKVIEIRGRVCFLKNSPRSSAQVYRRADVAETSESSDGPNRVLRIRFKDGGSVVVDRWFSGVPTLQQWLANQSP